MIRVWARSAETRSLDAIGFEASDLARLRDLLRRSMGIVLVTGPTRSGKTITLYAALRLIEMGVAPYLIRSAVIGVLAQRLVRINCEHCREVEPIDTLMRTNLGLGPQEVFWHGLGCAHCHGTGFAGRRAIYELLVMDKQLAEHVDVGVSADVYRASALASRMRSLLANAPPRADRSFVRRAWQPWSCQTRNVPQPGWLCTAK